MNYKLNLEPKKFIPVILLSVIIIVFVLMVGTVVFTFIRSGQYKYAEIKPKINFSCKEEKDLYNFIIRNLTAKNQGILTNTLDKPANLDLPAGKDVLSESVGLVMQYALETGSKSLFEKQYLFLSEVFLIKDNLIIWKVDEENGGISSTNALLDDLRICEALYAAGEKWGEEKYLIKARKIANSILRYNIKDALPIDWYDYKVKKQSNILSIRYINLGAIRKLAFYDEGWKNIYNKSLKVLVQSGLDKDEIFHFEEYDVSYGLYQKKSKVNMINQLITLENMLKAGLKADKTLEWLKASFKWYGFIVNEYDASTKKPASNVECPAIYALCSRAFLMVGDIETAEKFYKRMNIFKVSDKASSLYGGFAFQNTGEAYSFDNLEALLTIRYHFRSKLIP
jgi:hypothetical protein